MTEGIAALAGALERGEITAEDATRAFLARIEARDGALRAFIRVMRDEALAAARASDERRRAGAGKGTLDGIPLAIKDNIDVAGVPTSGGIRHYRDGIAGEDAFVTRRLRDAGAVILGKLNMHEAALGATGDNPWFGRCENPHRAGYTPGGSSSGSGAAVAAGLAAAALGTDTLGSVRVPASYCGTRGLQADLRSCQHARRDAALVDARSRRVSRAARGRSRTALRRLRGLRPRVGVRAARAAVPEPEARRCRRSARAARRQAGAIDRARARCRERLEARDRSACRARGDDR